MSEDNISLLFSDDFLKLSIPEITIKFNEFEFNEDQTIDFFTKVLEFHSEIEVISLLYSLKLSNMNIETKEDMEVSAKKISEQYHCAVLVKGGHQCYDADDVLYHQGKIYWFHGKRIDNPNTHGTGCTLSSAIASNLAKGYSLEDAIRYAKNYISQALNAKLDLGHGSGPMDHGFAISGEYKEGI